MITIEVLPNGDLQLTAPVEWANEQNDKAEELALWEGMEHYWANGSYWPFSAESGNPFVGLSSAPCIAEDMSVMDDGEHVINGRYWAFMNYQFDSIIGKLQAGQPVIFTLME